MKRFIVVVGILWSSLIPHSSSAQIPQIINYQGRLLSGTNLVNGSVGLSLRLFNVASNGVVQYEDSNTVTVADGLYSTFIGDNPTNAAFLSALTNAAVWIEVAVNGVALSPRERMASVPYALNVNASGLAGTIADANLSTNIARLSGTNQTFTWAVNFSGASNTFTGSFSGNGAGLTGVVHSAGDTMTGALKLPSSGLAVNTSDLVVTNGRTGIGTATPGQNLTVATSTSDTNATAKLGLLANGGHTWVMQSISGFDTNATVTAGTPAGSLQFVDPTQGFTAMTLTPGGNVGIGTTSPASALHIKSASSDSEISVQSGDTNSHRWTVQGSTATAGGSLASSFQIIDRTAVASRMLITTNGNVGIGTSTPSEQLHVNGRIVIADSANTPVAGTVRWNGSDFQGFDGTNWLSLTASRTPLVSMEFVTIGNGGNPGDTNAAAGAFGRGAVTNVFKMGKYEVTNAKYVLFLNSVDSLGNNSLGLYNTNMTADTQVGGISFQTNNAFGSKYVVRSGYGLKPVVYVSALDAMRFCNWLQNGAQAGSDTENGAYTLTGGTVVPSNINTVVRNAAAKFALPTENEWYKAAYYRGSGTAYSLYPMGGSTFDNNAPPGDASSANYSYLISSGLPALEDAGSYIAPSYYGTYDQGGNAREWTESIGTTTNRITRGGGWEDGFVYMQSAGGHLDLYGPLTEDYKTGFRIIGL
jgi:formylglycine-generating enzyme required for sulfatase activity